MEIDFEDVKLSCLSTINLIVGRNGSGKSRLLRSISKNYENNSNYHISYISPERSGSFDMDSNIEYAAEHNASWVREVRDRNNSERFKTISGARLRQLRLAYLSNMEFDVNLRLDLSKNFSNDILSKINSLLSNIYMDIIPDNRELVFKDYNGTIIRSFMISSGESEVVSLAIEILYFIYNIKKNKNNILLIDEPDVHLHPDLQSKLARFLANEIFGLETALCNKITIIIATHSTPIICAFSICESCKVGVKTFNSSKIIFNIFDEQMKKSAPFFAHPLSKSISDDPLFIVEGDDDVRVWQQAARTSQGKIKLFPCLAISVDQQTKLEKFCAKVLDAVYDTPLAYSVRDGDGTVDDLCSIGPVKRFRLHCYAIENLLLTDECLGALKSNWDDFKSKAKVWIEENISHKHILFVKELVKSDDRFRHKKIKDIRTTIGDILGSRKPWEVCVGQAIGRIYSDCNEIKDYSIISYIGPKLLKEIGAII